MLVAETDMAAYSNFTLLKLRSKERTTSQHQCNIFTVSVSVVFLRERLGQLVLEMSLRKAELDSLQELEPGRVGGSATKVTDKVSAISCCGRLTTSSRIPSTILQQQLTFLAVGLQVPANQSFASSQKSSSSKFKAFH